MGAGEPYANRAEAGRELAQLLEKYRCQHPVIFALPRGGVPVGREIAKRLAAPLDVVLVRKIGAPFQPELAIGAVVNGARAQIVTHDAVLRALDLPWEFVERQAVSELEVIEQRRHLYLGDSKPMDPEGRTAIIVDDGIATGTTMRAALAALRQGRPKRLVLAVPVAPPEIIEALRPEADHIVCPWTPDPFHAISLFYQDFSQVSDQDVVDMLQETTPTTSAW